MEKIILSKTLGKGEGLIQSNGGKELEEKKKEAINYVLEEKKGGRNSIGTAARGVYTGDLRVKKGPKP